MPQHLVISVRFLQPWFHGRTSNHEPEWPPSPLRLFQALVAAASRRWLGPDFAIFAEPALGWLERRPAPCVIASQAVSASSGYRLFVPDNVTDLVTAKWAAGKEASIAEYRTEKDVRPSRVLDGAEVHFVYDLAGAEEPPLLPLMETARSLTHLGWGIDQVAGDAVIFDDRAITALAGERWLPSLGSTAVRCRIPAEGTLADLIRRHAGFLARIGPDGFTPVPSLTTSSVSGYRRETDPMHRPIAAFALRNLDGRDFKAFDPLRRTRDIAGMARHAVAQTARDLGWPTSRINTFVHGKAVDGTKLSAGELSPSRFSYLPIPTMNTGLNRVEEIRRLVIAAPIGHETAVSEIRQSISGALLQEDLPDSPPIALLIPLATDPVLSCYLRPATTWTTVTPVILSGYDDRNAAKTERLLRLALIQAGFETSMVEHTEMEWRSVGFLPGVELASRYLPPENLNHRPRYQVKLRFPNPVAGPLAIGSGRFRGFGLFIAQS